VAENPRIEELRRRVQKDPASIAFAQLAEEFRRTGNYEEAVSICRTGLQTHPSYLSARVTLGRALLEMNDLENAEAELRYVLQHAAENLAAIRAMAEIHHRRGELTEALAFYKSALELARHDPDLEQTVDEITRAVSTPSRPAASAPAPSPPPVSALGTSSEEFLRNTFDLLELDPLDLAPEGEQPDSHGGTGVGAGPVEEETELELLPDTAEVLFHPSADQAEPFSQVNPALPRLERLLEAIHSYRQRRAV